jgi:hypothetical protein
LEKGREQGQAMQEARSQLAHNLTNAVYLTLAAKKEEAGEVAQAERLRQLLLYGSALDMQHAVDSGQLSLVELRIWSISGVMDEVAAYSRRHPDSLTSIEQDASRRHLLAELKELMDRHDPAKQPPGNP